MFVLEGIALLTHECPKGMGRDEVKLVLILDASPGGGVLLLPLFIFDFVKALTIADEQPFNDAQVSFRVHLLFFQQECSV